MEIANMAYNSSLRIYDKYLAIQDLADPYMDDYPGKKSPQVMFIVVTLYLLSVLIGPKIMANRQPFQLRTFMFCYNMWLCISNAVIASKMYHAYSSSKYSIQCMLSRPITTPVDRDIAFCSYLFYVTKFIELADTICFILRKKWSQLSILHVAHHSNVVFWGWVGINWFNCGSVAFLVVFVNGSVHVIMYLYYALAALGPSMEKYLWWKKYITWVQMSQFCFGAVMCANGLRIRCAYPLWMYITSGVYWIIFMKLFANYYEQAFRRDAKIKKQQQNTMLSQKTNTVPGKAKAN